LRKRDNKGFCKEIEDVQSLSDWSQGFEECERGVEDVRHAGAERSESERWLLLDKDKPGYLYKGRRYEKHQMCYKLPRMINVWTFRAGDKLLNVIWKGRLIVERKVKK
jgi:hypothetical protein